MLRRRITYLVLVSVAVCVFVVLVVMTIMTGLARDFESKNQRWFGNCILSSDSLVGFPYYEEFIKKLGSEDFIEALSPVIAVQGILTYQDTGYQSSVQVMGIYPGKHSRVTSFAESLYYHRDGPLRAFEPSDDANLPGIVLGIDKIRDRDEYGLYYHEPEPLVYSFSLSCFPLTARGSLARAAVGIVNSKTFYYSDDSHSALANVDGDYVYLPFDEVQILCGMAGGEKRASAIHIKFVEGVDIEKGRDRVRAVWDKFVEHKRSAGYAELLDGVRVETYKQFRREVMVAVEMERTMMVFVFSLLGLITVFIIFVVFYMIVSHKSKDIGILKSVGAGDIDVVSVFLLFAVLIGLLGSAIGTAAGAAFLAEVNGLEGFLFERYGFQLWSRAIYAIDDIPNKMDLNVVTAIIASAVAACLIAAVVPSYMAARLRPVDTLRVNRL
ncbi:MAG: ABC transporter permease [Sedimentisphaerales bacterium]|nr:ABC transporter permease [Sedimentisphaerales bacterium]